MFKKLVAILLLPALAVAQSPLGPIRINGANVSLEAPSGGRVSLIGGGKAVGVNENGNYINGSLATGLTAAGTTKDDALALSSDVNVVSTVGSGAGVKLPSSSSGNVRVTVRNTGANSLLVYPDAGGAIDGGSADAAVTVKVGETFHFHSTSPLTWVTTLTSGPTYPSVATGLTAAGSATGDALVLTSFWNVVTTTAASTGVRLGSGLDAAGAFVYIRNGGANTLSIYPNTGGTINGGSANAAITLATTKAVLLFRTAALTWVSLPGA